MPSPSKEKTWSYTVNTAITNDGNTDHCLRYLILDFKNKLKANGWTVLGSCDGTTVKGNYMDGVDLWATYTNLVCAGGKNNHSWIALQNTFMAGSPILVIDLNIWTSDYFLMFFSSGVSTYINTPGIKEAPLPTNYVSIMDGTSRFTGIDATTGTGYNFKAHILTTSDKLCTRYIVYKSSIPVFELVIDTLKNPISTITYPFFIMVRSSTNGSTSCLAYTDVKSSSTLGWVWGTPLTNVSKFVNTGYLAYDGIVKTGTDDCVTGGGTLSGKLLTSSLTVMQNGCPIGNLYDLWIDGAAGSAQGFVYETNDYVKMSAFIFPWNGSTPVIS